MRVSYFSRRWCSWCYGDFTRVFWREAWRTQEVQVSWNICASRPLSRQRFLREYFEDQPCLRSSSNRWSFIYSFDEFIHLFWYITNSQGAQLPVGLIAQSVKHCTGITEVMGSNPVQAWIFFKLLISQLLRLCVSAMINRVFTSFRLWHEEVQKRTKHPQETKIKRKMVRHQRREMCLSCRMTLLFLIGRQVKNANKNTSSQRCQHLSISFCVFQRSVVLPSDFPSEEVFEAYLHPVVDESTELFEWGKPDLHSLRLYPLSSKLGFLWSPWPNSVRITKVSFLVEKLKPLDAR